MSKAILISPQTKVTDKLRVAAYCRVSTNSQDQLNSYANQINVYTDKINRNDKWELVDIFADEGISGVTTKKRPEFLRMIQACESKKIDLVITKSVSRFARNVKESLEYVRKLKLLGVAVQFEKEGINTLSLGDELLLNTFSALAQEESKAISQNQRLSIVKRMELGEYVDSNAPYGYRLKDKKLIIYEHEAEVVRQIFKLYLNGYSTTYIANHLIEHNIPTKNGGVWDPYKISYILRNEKYVGDSLYQKKYRDTNVPFKQYANRGQLDQYYAMNTHPGIIDKQDFMAVQELYNKRKQEFNFRTTANIKYPLTGKIKCAECGETFKRRIISGSIKWACSKHLENKTYCKSYYYSEDQIYSGIITIINRLRFGNQDIIQQLIDIIDDSTQMIRRKNVSMNNIYQEILDINSKLLALEKLKSKGYINTKAYQNQSKTLTIQLRKLRSEQQSKYSSPLSTLREKLSLLQDKIITIGEPLTTIDESLVNDIIESIKISNKNEIIVSFLGGLEFTECI